MEGGGGSLREHLEMAARHSAKAAAELEAPPLPLAGAHLWQWFLELDQARGSNGWGLNPIGYGEIVAWAQLTRRTPAAWEVEILRALDGERMIAARPKEESKK